MRKRGGYYWVSPALVLLIVVSLIPFIVALTYSFRHLSYSIPGYVGQFAGLDNYREALNDKELAESVLVTLKIMIPALSLEFVLGLLLALLLYGQRRLRKFIIPLLIIPMTISPAVVGLIGNLSLNPEFGLIGMMMKKWGLVQGTSILGDSFLAMTTIILCDIWQWTPFMTMIFLAGLLSFPREPYEAAQIDGASSPQIFRLVTFPLMIPLATIAVLLRFIDVFKIFDTIWIMTQGGPGRATEAVSLYAYRVNFMHWHLGYGAAIVLLLFLISYCASFIFYKFATSRRAQGGVA